MLLNFYLINHFRELWPALKSLDLEGGLNVDDFSLHVRYKSKSIRLTAEFTQDFNGENTYTPHFSDQVSGFIGWRPYFNKRWPLSRSKLAFKNYVAECGLRTPEFSQDVTANLKDVIVKRNSSSFSRGIRGPFKESSESPLDINDGEYYEKYIPGNIVKLWYWNALPVAAEFLENLAVFGNGVSSISDLIRTYMQMLGRDFPDISQFDGFLAYQGKTTDTVPQMGEQCLIDFRYNSVIPTSYRARDIKIGTDEFFGLENELHLIGKHLWLGIPDNVRENTVYSVDAILDQQKCLWLLEMNSNPYVHPYVYPHMLKSIKGILVNRLNADVIPSYTTLTSIKKTTP